MVAENDTPPVDDPNRQVLAVNSTPQLILLTGMHRSGISFMAKRLAEANIPFPGDLLAANGDNPEGYWEAREIVELNNHAFQSLGMDWRDHGQITPQHMHSLIRKFTPRAIELLERFSANCGGRSFAIKDPRLCRLLPIWRNAAQTLGLETGYFVTVRRAEEVAHSLFRRQEDPQYRPAAIANPSKAMLLWARYMLDVARHFETLEPDYVRFEDLPLFDASDIQKQFDKNAKSPVPSNADDYFSHCNLPDFCARIYECFVSSGGADRDALLADARAYFEGTCGNERATDAAMDGPDIASLAQRFGRDSSKRDQVSIGFLSGAPDSKGHIYRVENRIEALIGDSWTTCRIDLLKDAINDIIEAFDVLYVFRMEASDLLMTLLERARSEGIAIIYDIDDLIFDPEYMSPEYFRFLETANEDVRKHWQNKSANYRTALERADLAIVPTKALAAHAKKYVSQVEIVPNGLSHARLRAAAKLQPKQRVDRIYIGYASGTATHDRDFEIVAPSLAKVLRAHPNITLVLQGPVDGPGLRILEGLEGQIERRALVSFHKLPEALLAYDINIAPLEIGNPFCESKSQLKYFEAALVGVPSVVSGTQCFKQSIRDGETGFIAEDDASWHSRLDELIHDKEARMSMGMRARDQAIQDFGPDAQRKSFKAAIEELVRAKSNSFRSALTALKKRPANESGFSLIEVLVSLGIASIVTMLIFGSLRQQFQLIDRVQNASAQALDLQARTRLMSNVLMNTSPAWPENESDQFQGNDQQISGVTGEAIFGNRAAMQQYRLRLIKLNDVSTLQLETEEGTWDMGVLPLDAHFLYYGRDGAWHRTWPPDRPTPRTIPEMELQAKTGRIPALVKIHTEVSNATDHWVFALYNTDTLSLRSQDLVGVQDLGLE